MTHNVGYGNNSVEISVLNENAHDTYARAEIKSIRMVGVGHGGATECIQVPKGMAITHGHFPTKCPAGEESNYDRTEC